MNIGHLLEKMRQKDENERKKLVFIFSFSLTGVIFVLWVVFFMSVNLRPVSQVGSVGALNIVDKESSPINELSNFIGQTVKTVTDGISQVKEVFKDEGVVGDKFDVLKNSDLENKAIIDNTDNTNIEQEPIKNLRIEEKSPSIITPNKGLYFE